MGAGDREDLMRIRAQLESFLALLDRSLGLRPDGEPEIDAVCRELRDEALLTNDIVDLLANAEKAILRVNGHAAVRLSSRQFLIVYALSLHRIGKLCGPEGSSAFLSAEVLTEFVREVGTQRFRDPAFWEFMPADLYREIHRLRDSVVDAGGTASLIESIRGLGYRLSTARRNLRLRVHAHPGAKRPGCGSEAAGG